MDDYKNPAEERCLTAEELQELRQEWQELQRAMAPIDDLVRRDELIDCEELHLAFAHLVDVFDDVERTIMRARQIRLLYAQEHHARR